MLGWKRGEGVLRRVSLLVCKMGPVYCPQAYGVGRGQVSESVLVRGLEQSLAHRMCQVHQRPWPSLRPSVVWVRRIRKGRPGGTVVDTDLCPRGASVVGDTVIVWGGSLHLHGGHSPVLEETASSGGEVQPLPGFAWLVGSPAPSQAP